MVGVLIYLKGWVPGEPDPPETGPRDRHHLVVTEPVFLPVISKPSYPAASNAASGPDHLTIVILLKVT
jgi:hypothetical protein